MNLFNQVRASLCEWPMIWDDGPNVRVATQCLYPSGGNVVVVLEDGVNSIVAHDDGGAIFEARSVGFLNPKPERIVSNTLRFFGVTMSDRKAICSPQVSKDKLIGSIIIIANASSSVARILCESVKKVPSHDIKEEMRKFIECKYHGRHERNVKITGESNKQHQFDYLLRGEGGSKLVLDVVTRDSNSINSSVVSHLDLKKACLKHTEQRIIYNDYEPWSSADLHLLSVGATPVPFTKATDVICRLAA